MTQGSRKPTSFGLGPAPAPPPGADADPFGQFEEPDELQGEATRLEPGLLLAEQPTHVLEEQAPQPYLECERGKDVGKQYVLSLGETGVGRSVDNEVILTDLSVSRRHLKIVREANGALRLVDLGSGNGTLLNGSRVREAPLRDGDRIELGETMLVVKVPGGVSAAPGPRGFAAPAVAHAAALPDAPRPAAPGGIVHGLTTATVGPSSAAGALSTQRGVTPYAGVPGGSSVPVVVGQPIATVAAAAAPHVAGAPTGSGSFVTPPAAPAPFALPTAGAVSAVGPTGTPAWPAPGPPPTSTPTAIATPPGRRGPPKGLLVVGAIVGTSLLVGAGAVLATHLVGGGDGANAVSPAVYQSAVAAYEQRRWDEAEARFRAVLAARPEDTEAARYLQLVQAGRAHEQTITAARAVLTGGDARGALAQVAAIPAQSPLAADAEAVRQAARDHIVRSLVEEARAAGAAGQGALAQAKLAEASSFDPTSVLVAQARAELGGVVHPGLIATAPASGTRNTPGPTAPALGGATRGAGNVGGGGTGSGGTAGSRGNAQALADRAMAAYRSGDYATAASTMRQATQAAPRTDQRRYEAQAQKLERLARDLPRAQSATATPQILQAVIEIDESIEGGGSVARTLKPRLAAMLVDAANRSWATGDVAGACGKARQALAADGTNRAARDLDSRCIAKVGELLSQAQRAERTSRQQAVGLYRQVTQIAPPGSPPHVQATERLGALEGSGFAATRGGPSAAGPTRSTGPTPTGPTPTGPMRTTGPTPTGPTPAGSTGPTKVRRPVILDEDE